MTIEEIREGDKFQDKYGLVKVMAFVDGHVMARRPRCMPFVMSASDFLKKYSKPL